VTTSILWRHNDFTVDVLEYVLYSILGVSVQFWMSISVYPQMDTSRVLEPYIVKCV
jgi:hypothetical protein